MEHLFYVGQRVVCVEKQKTARTNSDYKEEIFLNREYIVNEVGFYRSSIAQYYYVKVDNLMTIWQAKSFAPIVESYSDATVEILEKFKSPEETPDKVLIPETVNN